MKKVLVITYYWPPSGGAGVQRWLKFTKYLPFNGWEPIVLTVDPHYAAYPAIDTSLEKEVSEKIHVYRTRATDWFRIYGGSKSKVPSAGFAANRDDSPGGKLLRFIRGNFFIPDPRRGWNRYAFRKACELITNEDIGHIITTSPPHSTQLLGLKLKKRFPGIKWMADLRDPWTGIYYYDLFYPTFPARKIDSHYERLVLQNADIITTVGPSLGRHFESKISSAGNKIRIVHNGYDGTDFENITASEPERFTLSYTGTISESYPVEGFVKAVQRVIANGNDILIKFTGLIPDGQKTRFISALGTRHLEFIPYSVHETVVRQMISASMQLLVLARDPGNRTFLPGKLFEYIASRRPILCLGPTDGDCSDIINKGTFGRCFDYDEDEAISAYIEDNIRGTVKMETTPPAEYSRKNLAAAIAGYLE